MKVTVVGAGNGGSFTALHWGWYSRDKDVEVELIYNPDTPPERVGQATLLDAPHILWGAAGFNWYKNDIHATFKSGILYEGWGKKNDKLFHHFPADRMAMHYCPWEMQKSILETGHFKVTEGEVDPKDVDADYVFDCRGKPKDFTDYEELLNPINAAILAKPNWDTSTAIWSRHVATPDGWTFVIPTHESSPSNDYCVGYCYNSDITSKEDAEKNFLEMFDVEEIPTHGGSLRIFAKHKNDTSKKIEKHVEQLLSKEIAAEINSLGLYEGFQQRVDRIKYDALSFLIEEKKNGKTFIGYGAAAKGNTFLNYCGIKGTDIIEFVVDASPFKQNKFF